MYRKKCQKFGQFSLKKAFFRFFLRKVLARVRNFAKQNQNKRIYANPYEKKRKRTANKPRVQSKKLAYPWIRNEISMDTWWNIRGYLMKYSRIRKLFGKWNWKNGREEPKNWKEKYGKRKKWIVLLGKSVKKFDTFRRKNHFSQKSHGGVWQFQ